MVDKSLYKMLTWESRIYDIDDNDNLIPLYDEHGNPIFDKFTGAPTFKLLQDGTRHTASRENHREKGIYALSLWLDEMENWRIRKEILDEIGGRVPIGSSTIVDTLDGFSNKMFLQNQKAVVTTAITAGTTTITVDSSEGLTTFSQVTIYDDEHSEDVLITAIEGNTITVQAVTNAYQKGAKVARSNVVVDTVNKKMDNGNWETFNVSVLEVV
ncbi:hypothetical protein MKX79_03880 [Viridibacillus sp. FSL R5-0468]|uniref:hypothetical protein n=1 Tax=Viridibacillus sp. FSL R5-0468 TaxID=2921640 RepID=UPI0030FB59C8